MALLGSEPWTNQTRDELEKRTGMSCSDIYGVSEMIGPGVSYECWNKDGLHVNEDHFLVEVVDPATGEPVPEGKEGELVFTSLTKEALPVVRYRTGDLASLSNRPCACGRVFARHSKVYSRTDDMLIIRGSTCIPSSIEAVLADLEGVEPRYRILAFREGALDQIEIQIELEPSFMADTVRKLQSVPAGRGRAHAPGTRHPAEGSAGGAADRAGRGVTAGHRYSGGSTVRKVAVSIVLLIVTAMIFGACGGGTATTTTGAGTVTTSGTTTASTLAITPELSKYAGDMEACSVVRGGHRSGPVYRTEWREQGLRRWRTPRRSTA